METTHKGTYIATQEYDTNQESKRAKKIWNEKIIIHKAIIDSNTTYCLLDENYDFIPIVTDYLDMIHMRSDEGLSPNTIKTYCYHFWYFIVFLKMNGLEILDLDGEPYLLSKFKFWLKNPFRFSENIELFSENIELEDHKDSLKVGTINSILSTVSSLYIWLNASGQIYENPVIYKNIISSNLMQDKDMLTHIKRSRSVKVNTLKLSNKKKKVKVISEKNFKKVLNSVNLLRDKIILLCLKEGGFRSGELLGIHLSDIDFAKIGIYVKFRPDNINNTRAKAGYGNDRFVNLPADLMILIERYISTEWWKCRPKNDFLFVVIKSPNPADNGNPMKKFTLDSIVRNSMKKTGVKFYPHMLRHTHATELAKCYIDKGELINWKFISVRLGHASVTTTIEIYSHLDTEDFKKEYIRMQEYRNSKRKEK